jgi:hypothetical protein
VTVVRDIASLQPAAQAGCLRMSDSTHRRNPWWEFLLPGVIFLFGSIYVWWYLSELERTPGVHQLPSAAALLYNWGGKRAVVLMVAAVGALFSGIGMWKLLKKRRTPKQDTRDS